MQILNSVTPPDLSIIPDNASLPQADLSLIGLPSPVYSPEGLCNTYLPNSSTLERFAWLINYLTEQGFIVGIVNQFNMDPTFSVS